jgi:hypothetical protein
VVIKVLQRVGAISRVLKLPLPRLLLDADRILGPYGLVGQAPYGPAYFIVPLIYRTDPAEVSSRRHAAWGHQW